MYELNTFAYCGMSGIEKRFDDRGDARQAAAKLIRSRRKKYKVVILTRGERWEVLEPANSVMVPDACGIIRLDHETYECEECGGECDTKEQARNCCNEFVNE